MHIFPTVESLQNWVNHQRQQNKNIGFVPTMGALHEGHLSLIEQSQQQSDLTIVSIFVNPTQFNDSADLERYPRKDSDDIALLKKQKVDALFFPSVTEMYPKGTKADKVYDFGNLATVMEGAHRKGHFEGVAQVVNLLLNYVTPDKLFMGQKDFQQVAIIKKLLQIEAKQIELITCPTVREADGLAMSSRNALLTENERKQAPKIRQALLNLKANFQQKNIEVAIKAAIDFIETDSDMKVEYLEISDATSLQKANAWNNFDKLIACTAVHLGKVRLIDNILIS